MELGAFRNFKIQLREDNSFAMNSTDNVHSYSIQYLEGDYRNTKIGVELIDEKGMVINSVILGGSDGSSSVHAGCGLIDNERMLLCVSNLIYCLELPTFKLLWQTKADDATCFQIQQISDGYIVHGEMQISRLDKSGKIIWSNSGADIFTTPDGIDDFGVSDEIIKVRDWNGKLYRFDLNGKTHP